MKWRPLGKLSTFAALDHGSLFIGGLYSQSALCLKVGSDAGGGRKRDWVVVFAPSPSPSIKAPYVLPPDQLHLDAVLELDDVELTFPCSTNAISYSPRSDPGAVGRVTVIGDHPYLWVIPSNPAHSTFPVHISIVTGHVVDSLPQGPGFYVDQWSLMAAGETEPLFRFEVPTST
jgi:hypothetical protein